MPEALSGSAQRYVGRFAPSPTGPLHKGSLVAAMASFIDARAHHGKWLLRIEDIDTTRVEPGADRIIMAQLHSLGMPWDGDPCWQSARQAGYRQAFATLSAQGSVYGCACTRREIDTALRRQAACQAAGAGHVEQARRARRIYPGTCRNGLAPGKTARSWRFRTPAGIERFHDRWQGPQQQDVEHDMGDFIIRRADGMWAYQLAVVVDDNAQAVTDIVRGADLLESTGAQRMLATSLGMPCPRVMHVPLVRDHAKRKLSKQNHAPALDCTDPVRELHEAWLLLGFDPMKASSPTQFWTLALPHWANRFKL